MGREVFVPGEDEIGLLSAIVGLGYFGYGGAAVRLELELGQCECIFKVEGTDDDFTVSWVGEYSSV